MNCGLAAGEFTVALNDLKVSTGNIDEHLKHKRAGDTIKIHAFRRDELMTFDVTLMAPPLDTCYLTLMTRSAHKLRAFVKTG